MTTATCEADGCRAERFLRDLNMLFVDAVRVGYETYFLHRVVEAAARAVGGTRGFLALVEEQTGELVVVASIGAGWTRENARLRVSLANAASRGITGHVAVTGLPYISDDVDNDPLYLAYFDDVKSEIAVPILGTSGQSTGVINIESPDAAAFGEDDIDRLTSLSHVASAALRVQGFRAREDALIEIGNRLTLMLDVDSLLNHVVDVASEVLRFEDCSVFLVDEALGRLVLGATRGSLVPYIGEPTYRIGEGLTGWVAQHGEPVRLETPHTDPRWLGKHVEFPEAEIGALLLVPIASRGRTMGVLRVLRRKSLSVWYSNRFSEGEERVLSSIASQLGTALENVRSHERLVQAERMAAWGEMSARAAHMIGNRTFALKGDLNEMGFLLEKMPQHEARHEIAALAGSMTRGVERLEEILREFRDFVMATKLDLEDADLSAVVREVLMETFPKRCAVTLSASIDDRVLPIRADVRKLKRAFSELVENAISFQPDGGELGVRTFVVTPEDRALNGMSASRLSFGVEFADAGPGVPPEAKERIFQPFYTSRVKGMGLGLSIVKGIVEAHQGAVRESGVAGEGAMFSVYLPAAEAASEE